MFHKGTCVEGLVSSVWHYKEEAGPSRKKWAHWGHALERSIGVASFFLCLPASLLYHALLTLMLCLTTSPKAMGPSDHGLKLLKLNQNILFFLSVVYLRKFVTATEGWLTQLSSSLFHKYWNWNIRNLVTPCHSTDSKLQSCTWTPKTWVPIHFMSCSH
jgi:hypothetical protein